MTASTPTTLYAGHAGTPGLDPWDCYRPVPKNGERCPVSGLGHARLYQLLLWEPAGRKIRTIQLRQPGATRGLLLYHLGDLKAHLERLAVLRKTEQEANDEGD